MVEKVIATLPALVRPLIEARLPDWLAPRWFTRPDEGLALLAGAEIAWLDVGSPKEIAAAVASVKDALAPHRAGRSRLPAT